MVDEAHNLRDYMRGLRSGFVTLDDVEGAEKEATVLMMADVCSDLKHSGRCSTG